MRSASGSKYAQCGSNGGSTRNLCILLAPGARAPPGCWDLPGRTAPPHRCRPRPAPSVVCQSTGSRGRAASAGSRRPAAPPAGRAAAAAPRPAASLAGFNSGRAAAAGRPAEHRAWERNLNNADPLARSLARGLPGQLGCLTVSASLAGVAPHASCGRLPIHVFHAGSTLTSAACHCVVLATNWRGYYNPHNHPMAAMAAAALCSGRRAPSPAHRGPWPCSDRSTWLRSWPAGSARRSRRARPAAAGAAASSSAAADRCHFDVLGLPRSATREQVKQAYRRLARQWHPDVNASPRAAERFKVRAGMSCAGECIATLLP